MGIIFGFIYDHFRYIPASSAGLDRPGDPVGVEYLLLEMPAVIGLAFQRVDHLRFHRFLQARCPSLPSWLSFRGLRGGEFRNLADLEFRAIVPELTPPLLLLLAPLPQEDLRCQVFQAHSCCVPRRNWLMLGSTRCPKPPPIISVRVTEHQYLLHITPSSHRSRVTRLLPDCTPPRIYPMLNVGVFLRVEQDAPVRSCSLHRLQSLVQDRPPHRYSGPGSTPSRSRFSPFAGNPSCRWKQCSRPQLSFPSSYSTQTAAL